MIRLPARPLLSFHATLPRLLSPSLHSFPPSLPPSLPLSFPISLPSPPLSFIPHEKELKGRLQLSILAYLATLPLPPLLPRPHPTLPHSFMLPSLPSSLPRQITPPFPSAAGCCWFHPLHRHLQHAPLPLRLPPPLLHLAIGRGAPHRPHALARPVPRPVCLLLPHLAVRTGRAGGRGGGAVPGDEERGHSGGAGAGCRMLYTYNNFPPTAL